MACVIVPSDTYIKLGGLDEKNFFMYCDDVDFSWRLRLNGKKVIYCPGAVVFHGHRLNKDGLPIPTEAELYYSAEAALMLAYKWSNKRHLGNLLRYFETSGSKYQKKALAYFKEREKNGDLPEQLDKDHKIAYFKNGATRNTNTACRRCFMNSCKTKSNLISSYYSRIKELYGEKNANMLLNGSDIAVDGEVPFLSVVMRTQGKRICALKEALLCLYAQTCRDFEVLLMAHNVDDAKTKEIEDLISSFPHDFLNKIRLIPVTGGTRTTPLIEGFKAARGIYISIYDDDDIVFDNWVETFRSLYDEAPGRILHAYATEQDWTVLKSGGSISLTTCSAPKPVYCCKFNMVNQLSINRCPTMSLAFPFIHSNC